MAKKPKYTSVEQIEGLVEEYFKSCEGEPLLDDEGRIMLDKWGQPIILKKRPPTVTGLALALGFATRDALLRYQAKKEFNEAITRAKTRIEMYTEERLFDKEGSNGAKFSLQNNFKGWSPLQEEAKAPAINIICDIPRSLIPSNPTEVVESIIDEQIEEKVNVDADSDS